MIDLLIYFLDLFYIPLLNKRRQEREHNSSHAPLLASTKLLAYSVLKDTHKVNIEFLVVGCTFILSFKTIGKTRFLEFFILKLQNQYFKNVRQHFNNFLTI